MFKISNYALAMALLLKEAASEAACAPGLISSFSGECNYDNFMKNLAKGCDAADISTNYWRVVGSDQYCATGLIADEQGSTPSGVYASQQACQSSCESNKACNFYLYRHDPTTAATATSYTCATWSTCTSMNTFQDGDGGLIYQKQLLTKAKVDEMCASASAPAEKSHTKFGEIQGTYQLDRRYFQGGGPLMDGGRWDRDVARIKRFEANGGADTIIGWPEYEARVKYNKNNGYSDKGYPTNMNLEKGCGLNSAMCCFTDDSRGEKFPTTTDVCVHDLANSPHSNHIKKGWSIFPGGETSTHCVGFTWNDGETELVGNMMYDASLRNSAIKGYLGAVPGAPVCGCIEHMPVVESSACRTVKYSDAHNFNSIQTGRGPEMAGWCVKANGDDEDAGVTKVSSNNVKSAAEKNACVLQCINYGVKNGIKVTGCESIYDQDNRGCYVHTSNTIAKGSGADHHSCWLVKSLGDSVEGGFSLSNSRNIAYSDCADGADLKTAYKAKFRKGDAARDLIDAHLVGKGGCIDGVADYLNNHYLVQTVDTLNWAIPDPKQWSELVVGEGRYFNPPHRDRAVADPAFRKLIGAGCKKADGTDRACIVRRVCTSCAETHRDIYYQRKTDFLNGGRLYLLNMFMNSWVSTGNNMANGDFELYSTYNDALEGKNKWTYCNYASDTGFPRDCGPTGKVDYNWNSYTKRGGNANDHGFYVEKPPVK